MNWGNTYQKPATEHEVSEVWRLHDPMMQPILAALENHGTALEVGVGTGAFLTALAERGHKVEGIDNDYNIVAQVNAMLAPRKLKAFVRPIDAFNLGKGNYAVAYSQGLLEHFNDEDIVALLNAQLLAAQRVVASVPSLTWGDKLDQFERHMTLEQWRDILEPHFVIADLNYYFDGRMIYFVLDRKEQHKHPARLGQKVEHPLRIKYVSQATQDNHGYGRIGYRLRPALASAGAEMIGRVEGNWGLRVVIGTLDSWYLDRFQPDLVLHTMWEATPLPSNWFPWINNAGLIWVPSQFVKDIMEGAGVTRPIFVSGYGVDPKEYSPVERVRDKNSPYVFMVWARMLVDRKCTLDAVRGFMEADLPNSKLIIKHNFNLGMPKHEGPLSGMFPDVDVENFRGTYKGRPIRNVTLLTGDLAPADIRRLMGHCDCLVYPSANEGFGLMPMEAMATGMAVIAPAHSGLAEYVRPDVARVLPVVDMVEDEYLAQVWGQPCKAARVSVDDIAKEMTWCYEHREEAAEMGKRAAEMVQQEWTWEAAGKRALAHLRQYHESLDRNTYQL